METDNPYVLLVDIYDGIKWSEGLLDIMKAENKAMFTYFHWLEIGNQKMIDKSWGKYQKLRKTVDEYPEAKKPMVWTGAKS